MINKSDIGLVERFVSRCAKLGFTLEQMGESVGRTKAWASRLVLGEITRPHWRTRNRIKEFLGEL